MNEGVTSRAPLKRWQTKISLGYIISKMSKEKKQNLSTFLRVLWTIICQCIAYASICSRLYDEKELIKYFNHLIRARVNEFIKGRRKHPQQLKEISFYQNSIPKIVQKYKRTMREKRQSFQQEQHASRGGQDVR